MKKILAIVSILICFNSYAQNVEEYGSVNIIADYNIDALVRKHISMNERKQTKKGFRVQLIQNSSRSTVLDRKAEFLSAFPQYRTYLIYAQPYFKLRVGDYDNRLEAYRSYLEILRKFRNATIVPDIINVKL